MFYCIFVVLKKLINIALNMSINAIIIAVSPMTRKMLLSLHGCEPIQIPNKSAISDLLHITPQSDNSNEAAATLTAQVMILANAELKKRLLTKAGRVVGMAMHRYFLRKQNEFVEWNVSIGNEAKASLESFRAINGIDEDDYALESAYRSWTRYKSCQKNDTIIMVKKKRDFVRPLINHCLVAPKPFAAKTAIDAVTKVWQIDGDIFTRTYNNTPKKVCAYLMRQEGGLTLKQIAQTLRMKNLTRISAYISEIQTRIIKNPSLKKQVEACIELI